MEEIPLNKEEVKQNGSVPGPHKPDEKADPDEKLDAPETSTKEEQNDVQVEQEAFHDSDDAEAPQEDEGDSKPAALSLQELEEQRLGQLRKRNAIYSKRKYYKKKREVAKIEQTRYELEANNHTLKRENKRLEALLLEVQQRIALQNSMFGGRVAPGFPPSLLAQGFGANNNAATLFNPQLISSLMAPGGNPLLAFASAPALAGPADANQLRNFLLMNNQAPDGTAPGPAPNNNKELLDFLASGGNQNGVVPANNNANFFNNPPAPLAGNVDTQLQFLLATLNQQNDNNNNVARLPVAQAVGPAAANNEALLQLFMLQQLQNQR